MTVRENVYYFGNLRLTFQKSSIPTLERYPVECRKKLRSCALSIVPKLFILDEPLVGLDVRSCLETEEVIKELPKEATLIVCSHDLRFIERVSDRMTVINKEGGTVASGTSPELRGEINYFKY